jgi:hypothetical protein
MPKRRRDHRSVERARSIGKVRSWPKALCRSMASAWQLSKVLWTKCGFRLIDRRAEAAAISGMASGLEHMTMRAINHRVAFSD